MKTAVISDLHLGSRGGRDLLSDDVVRKCLTHALADADRIVLLGDVLELRERPISAVIAAAEPILSEIGRAAPDAQITLTAGNHDHRMAGELLDRGALNGDGPTPVELELTPNECPDSIFESLARALGPDRVRLSYPGVRIRADVWATHGHYLDAHNSVPAFEAVAAAFAARATSRLRERDLMPGDYEAVLSPLYSLLGSLAQRSGERGAPGGGASVKVLQQLRDPRGRFEPVKVGLERALIPGAVLAINKLAGARFDPDLSGPELRRAGLRAIGEVVDRLGVEADHIIFGHTHRRGPLAGDNASEWRTQGGAELHNCGSWVWEPWLVGPGGADSPYWPGNMIVVEDIGPPRLVPLLESVPAT